MRGRARFAACVAVPLAVLGAGSQPIFSATSSQPTLPAPGRLLVEVPAKGAFIVARDGARRRLGEWYETAWSADGRLIAAARGRTVAALDADGRVVWSLRRSAAFPLRQPDWSADGLELAYRSGDSVRVVGRDGSGDRVVARGLRFAGPRWRPGAGHLLAWADRRGRVRLLDVASGRTLWRSSPGPSLRPWGLMWSRDGTTLAAVSGASVRVFDAGGGELRRVRARGTERFEAAALARTGSSRLLLVRHDIRRGGSRVTTVAARRAGAHERRILAGRGRVVDVTTSPDGRWALLGWRGGDQWRFVRLRGGKRVVSVDRVTRRLNGKAVGRWAFPTVRAWCCPP